MANIFNIFGKRNGANASKPADLHALIEPYKHTAWFPQTLPRNSPQHASKFAGVPVLAVGESWPCCRHCNEPMQLFLQLNSEHLPEQAEKPFGEGFLQVFYCTNWEKECEIECEAFFPFSQSTLVRLLSFEIAQEHNAIESPVKDAFPEREIIGWNAKDDYPNWEELEELGCALSEEQANLLCDQEFPLPKDKLLGWPCWVQSVEYPDCPECGQRMHLVFQIDSEDNLPYMFGDAGCSHITQCKEHKDQLAIAWACS